MRFQCIAAFVAVSLALAGTAYAQKAYDTGVTDTEIKIGNTMPYSGPASAYSSQGRAETAYYKMINAKGGVNGRKINFITYDDAYSPPKTVEQTRKLVEQDEIFANFGSLGTPTNTAIHKYLNQKKMPHLFVSTGAAKWNDPRTFPWTLPLYPSYQMEGRVAGKYVVQTKPDGKIAILYQNDDFGKDYVKGFKEGLGNKVAQVVIEKSYEVTDPTLDSQLVALKVSGADVLYAITTPKFGAQAIKKAGELNWKPLFLIASVSSSIKSALEPAGIENSTGLVTAIAGKVASDPRWKDAPDMKEFLAFVKEWMPGENPDDASLGTGYGSAWMTVKVLTECGDNLTRENLMKVVTRQNNVAVPLLLPGITLTITADNYAGYGQLQMVRFDGKTWEPIGPVISAE
ncbi:ABC transporter substrate-binding protein [Bradyrhizobium sp.]|uniref:ABC transporter substrate-binding protein n=1 Tax=Bradyrhizobium sp. TaxID=376 RepID=UPI0023A2A3D5|nr:ABC transporter substrate-binding protein [Bradyrhizobium sp.]MDE2379542.1 ABC transporter substrate-binding protein [Bradyrhizobium sp.]